MPDANIKIDKTKAPPGNRDHYFDTAHAFIQAAKRVKNFSGNWAVCDLDLMFINSIEDIWEKPFDIAITTRKTIKYNTGIWFIRDNERAKDFLHKWIVNTEILVDMVKSGNEEIKPYIHENGGIDQASLDMTINHEISKAKVFELDSTIWNACQHEWEHVTEETKIIHIKSNLRKFCFRQKKEEPPEYMKPLIKTWRMHYDYTKKLYGVDRKTTHKKYKV
jgi:hypothetical protein